MKELGTESIFALSPQAKGRIERVWGTFQDRLVSELRLVGASTLEEANQVLCDFLPRFNARFGVPADLPEVAYRRLPHDLELDGVLCFKYQRSVGSDNTVRFGGRTLQLLPGLDRMSYAHARVEVQERLDGSLVVNYKGEVIATREAPPHPAVLRARKGDRSQVAGSTNIVVGLIHEGDQGCAGVRRVLDHEPARPQLGNNGNGHKPGPNHPWRKPLLTKSLNN